MRFPSRKIPDNISVGYAVLPTRLDNGTWVWLEWYRWRVKEYVGRDFWYKVALDD